MEELKEEIKTLHSPFCPHPFCLQSAMVFFGYNSVYILYNFTPVFPIPYLFTQYYSLDFTLQIW